MPMADPRHAGSAMSATAALRSPGAEGWRLTGSNARVSIVLVLVPLALVPAVVAVVIVVIVIVVVVTVMPFSDPCFLLISKMVQPSQVVAHAMSHPPETMGQPEQEVGHGTE